MTTHTLPLTFDAGHLFLEDGDRRYLVDTGSPISLAAHRELRIAERTFPLHP